MKTSLASIAVAALVAVPLWSSGNPAFAAPPGEFRAERHHYRPERPQHHHHERPNTHGHYRPHWGGIGAAGLALGALALTIDSPRQTVIVATPPAPPPPRPMWYYCDSAQAYYPYIGFCPEGWRMVPAY